MASTQFVLAEIVNARREKPATGGNFCHGCTTGPAKIHHLQPDFRQRKKNASHAAPRRQRSPFALASWTAPQGFGEAALWFAPTHASQSPPRAGKEKRKHHATPDAPRRAAPYKLMGDTTIARRAKRVASRANNREDNQKGNRTTPPVTPRPPRHAVARQCAGAAQRPAQACRWRDNNEREQDTNTPHTVAPRHRSPVRRGGATARSGMSLAR